MERIQELDDDKCFELIESINKIIDLIKGQTVTFYLIETQIDSFGNCVS